MTDDFDWDSFVEDLPKYLARYQVQKDHTYVLDLIVALRARLKGDQRTYVIDRVRKKREQLGLSIPASFDEAVQSAYNQHCVDSEVFKKRGSPDEDGIFHSPHGKYKGIWAVYPDKASRWIKRRVLSDPDIERS